MGGRTIKYPTRRKYIVPNQKSETIEKEITSEEHNERMRKLKELGLLKE